MNNIIDNAEIVNNIHEIYSITHANKLREFIKIENYLDKVVIYNTR